MWPVAQNQTHAVINKILSSWQKVLCYLNVYLDRAFIWSYSIWMTLNDLLWHLSMLAAILVWHYDVNYHLLLQLVKSLKLEDLSQILIISSCLEMICFDFRFLLSLCPKNCGWNPLKRRCKVGWPWMTFNKLLTLFWCKLEIPTKLFYFSVGRDIIRVLAQNLDSKK